MVKFSNKGKGKPSKRRSLKTKYKIERKVKQHRKKMRKEARKLNKKGIKPKKHEEKNALPNSFPFKHQILQHFKSQKPVEEHCPTISLDPTEWGLVAIEPRTTYFPLDKDHLTKKYITNQDKVWAECNTVIEVLDCRNFGECITPKIRKQCEKRRLSKITVLSKTDTVSQKHLQSSKQKLEASGEVIVQFSTEHKKKNSSLQNLIKAIETSREGTKKCIVVGKANTGKHSILKLLMKLTKYHNQDYATIAQVQITSTINVVDTPYKINDDGEYPLFHPPSNLSEESVISQEERVLKNLFLNGVKNRSNVLIHFGIQDYNSLDDFLKKVGKVSRTFGKGGMVDLTLVRSNVLKAWYSGKLNHLFELK